MTIEDCEMRIADSGKKGTGTGETTADHRVFFNPQSAIRNPQWFIGAGPHFSIRVIRVISGLKKRAAGGLEMISIVMTNRYVSNSAQ